MAKDDLSQTPRRSKRLKQETPSPVKPLSTQKSTTKRKQSQLAQANEEPSSPYQAPVRKGPPVSTKDSEADESQHIETAKKSTPKVTQPNKTTTPKATRKVLDDSDEDIDMSSGAPVVESSAPKRAPAFQAPDEDSDDDAPEAVSSSNAKEDALSKLRAERLSEISYVLDYLPSDVLLTVC